MIVALLVVSGLGLLCCFYGLFRNKEVCDFRRRMLYEESAFLQKQISEHKGYDRFRRFDDLPSYNRMVVEFWKPIVSYEKPLNDYYGQ